MAWSERQLALLQAMGLRVWLPAAADPVKGGPPSATPSVAPAARHAAASAVEPVVLPLVAPAPAPAVPPAVASQARPVTPGPPPSAVHQSLTPVQAVSIASPAPDNAAAARQPVPVGLDWPALRDAVAGCQACGLCQSRTQTVFGVGHPQAHWMVVGEAPGEEEDRQGEPFVGASGELLDRMLAALGLTRDSDGPAPMSQRVYIANTLKCRPPRNRNPAPEEMLQCEPFLRRQIELLQPRLILAMGRFAVQALLRSSEPVGKLRGRVHRYHGVPLVVTYHPAYLLRNLPDKARAWEDLCLAASVAETQAGVSPQA